MPTTQAQRAGRYIRQASGDAGYRSFIPTPLPPSPALELTPSLIAQLSEADRALARLDGAAGSLPNPDLFVAQFVRKEALLSSQIEGTQASLADLFEHEAGREALRLGEVDEVVNYIKAMNHGLERIDTLPLSLRLLREIHGVLLSGVRGQDRAPGEFRRSQNWIGPQGGLLRDAIFVPPPAHELMGLLGQLESYLHDGGGYPPLIEAALVHAQFETLHPFLDGNGRIGRLLITFQLCHAGVLRRPVLYLSLYLKQHRQRYYELLMHVRDTGDWETWVSFFLEAVAASAQHALRAAQAISMLREQHLDMVRAHGLAPAGLVLVDKLLERPIVSVQDVAAAIARTFATANRLVTEFERLGLLVESTGRARNRRFMYREYYEVLREGTDSPP